MFSCKVWGVKGCGCGASFLSFSDTKKSRHGEATTERMETPLERRLDDLWEDGYEGLPFSTSVNEARVLAELSRASPAERRAMHDRVRLWMRFNRAINVYEEDPYQTWVEQVYSKIDALYSSDSADVEEADGR